MQFAADDEEPLADPADEPTEPRTPGSEPQGDDDDDDDDVGGGGGGGDDAVVNADEFGTGDMPAQGGQQWVPYDKVSDALTDQQESFKPEHDEFKRELKCGLACVKHPR